MLYHNIGADTCIRIDDCGIITSFQMTRMPSLKLKKQMKKKVIKKKKGNRKEKETRWEIKEDVGKLKCGRRKTRGKSWRSEVKEGYMIWRYELIYFKAPVGK